MFGVARWNPAGARRIVAALLVAAAAGCGQTAPTAPFTLEPNGSHPIVQPTGSPAPGARQTQPFTPAAQPTDLVTAFFYAWYGSLSHDGAWRHWDQNGHDPPGDIASSYYPLRGPYSSRDPAVLAAQMAELRDAGVGAIAVSWWGQGGWDDETLDAVFAAAGDAGIKVAFHIEPYSGRTPASIVADVHALLARYGKSQALLRIARPTSGSPNPSPRPVFYIFASSQLPTDGLQKAIASLRGTADDSIVLLHSPRARTATRVGADGVYTYDPLVSDPSEFGTLVSDCRAANLICSPSVSPGFDNTHAVSTGLQMVDRAGGSRYDSLWQEAIDAQAEWVSIVSYNEWHEGTAIEPARPFSSGGRTYLSFDGAFGQTGTDAAYAYLERTAYWVEAFEAGR